MSSDSDALLATVLKFPADDTARLVYADWLDEHAGTSGYSPCPECKGEGRPARQYPLLCHTCGGTGLVPASDGFAERAEFIRVQCELARLLASSPPIHGVPDWTAKVARAKTRSWAIEHERAREWGGIPCPACEGMAKYGEGWECVPCNNTGFAPVEFRRGFVERVRCRINDVLIRVCGRCKGTGNDPAEPMHPCLRCLGSRKPAGQYESAWTLTPWARGVLAAHPVTAWEITDLPANIAVLPQPAYRAACAIDPNPGTREREVEVIALAVARVARRLAGLPEVTP